MPSMSASVDIGGVIWIISTVLLVVVVLLARRETKGWRIPAGAQKDEAARNRELSGG